MFFGEQWKDSLISSPANYPLWASSDSLPPLGGCSTPLWQLSDRSCPKEAQVIFTIHFLVQLCSFLPPAVMVTAVAGAVLV